ncbi:MAG: NAD-dependent epimerase/dehydratase family protein [Alphaproteobacteria bacterium]
MYVAAREHGKLNGKLPVVYTSSAAVYGNNANLPLAEDATTRPFSAYGADKLGWEQHAGFAGRVHGLPTSGFRFFNIYSPRQDPNSPYSGVIAIFTEPSGEGAGHHNSK